MNKAKPFQQKSSLSFKWSLKFKRLPRGRIKIKAQKLFRLFEHVTYSPSIKTKTLPTKNKYLDILNQNTFGHETPMNSCYESSASGGV